MAQRAASDAAVAPLHTALRRFFQRRVHLPRGATVVVAVSGGPDSLALLHALSELREELGLRLHVAHLDHMVRGAQSAAEAAFVAETARAWGLPATLGSEDVRRLASAWRENLYAAGRRARYQFLARVAAETGAQAVATGHHADDQAETVLAHLLRGAGPEGLAGMRPVTPWEEWAPGPTGAAEELRAALIRPLLEVTRAEIEAYCAASGLAPRRDPSNEDRRRTRARIRHELLPYLIEYNPRIVEALCRTAAVCAEEQAFVAAALDAAWPALVEGRPGALAFRAEEWARLHPALQRAAIRRAHQLLAPGVALGLEDVERARELPGSRVGRRVELPGGVSVTAGYGGAFVVAAGEPAPPDGPQLEGERAPLPVPGSVPLAMGWQLRAELATGAVPADPWEVYLDAAVAGRLEVRRRRAGDVLRPAGGRGSRRLQDVLVDAKVPRALRDAWPLVTVEETIVWVPGVRAGEGFVAAAGAPAVRVWVQPPAASDRAT